MAPNGHSGPAVGLRFVQPVGKNLVVEPFKRFFSHPPPLPSPPRAGFEGTSRIEEISKNKALTRLGFLPGPLILTGDRIL